MKKISFRKKKTLLYLIEEMYGKWYTSDKWEKEALAKRKVRGGYTYGRQNQTVFSVH